jgi:hypothetical protein
MGVQFDINEGVNILFFWTCPPLLSELRSPSRKVGLSDPQLRLDVDRPTSIPLSEPRHRKLQHTISIPWRTNPQLPYRKSLEVFIRLRPVGVFGSTREQSDPAAGHQGNQQSRGRHRQRNETSNLNKLSKH